MLYGWYENELTTDINFSYFKYFFSLFLLKILNISQSLLPDARASLTTSAGWRHPGLVWLGGWGSSEGRSPSCSGLRLHPARLSVQLVCLTDFFFGPYVGVWDKILEPVACVRKKSEMLQLFPAYLKGEDLFGLTVSAVARIAESVSEEQGGPTPGCPLCGGLRPARPADSHQAHVQRHYSLGQLSKGPHGHMAHAVQGSPPLQNTCVPVPDRGVCGHPQAVGECRSPLGDLLGAQECFPISLPSVLENCVVLSIFLPMIKAH